LLVKIVDEDTHEYLYFLSHIDKDDHYENNAPLIFWFNRQRSSTGRYLVKIFASQDFMKQDAIKTVTKGGINNRTFASSN
jgi:hypothetical protein